MSQYMFLRACARYIASARSLGRPTLQRGTDSSSIRLCDLSKDSFGLCTQASVFHIPPSSGIKRASIVLMHSSPAPLSNAGTNDNKDDLDSSGGSKQLNADARNEKNLITLPTALTLLRIASIPFVIYLVHCPGPAAASSAAGVFIAASLTDWLDGYLARKLNSSSSFGAFLDPVADKLMVCSVLVLISSKTFTYGLFSACPWLLQILAVAIICREVAMSALREHAATLGPEARAATAVNTLGKYKTALQLSSLTMLLFAMNGGDSLVINVCSVLGPWALIGATVLTWQSFIAYLRAMWRFMT